MDAERHRKPFRPCRPVPLRSGQARRAGKRAYRSRLPTLARASYSRGGYAAGGLLKCHRQFDNPASWTTLALGDRLARRQAPAPTADSPARSGCRKSLDDLQLPVLDLRAKTGSAEANRLTLWRTFSTQASATRSPGFFCFASSTAGLIELTLTRELDAVLKHLDGSRLAGNFGTDGMRSPASSTASRRMARCALRTSSLKTAGAITREVIREAPEDEALQVLAVNPWRGG